MNREQIVSSEVYAGTSRKEQAEGAVLIENRENALPLPAGSRVALFGRTQFAYYKSGLGSGGLVNSEYVTGVREAILQRNAYELSPSLERAYAEWLPDHPTVIGESWDKAPWWQEEMVPSEELAAQASREADAAIVIIGRFAGEERDNKPERGSWYLTEQEETML